MKIALIADHKTGHHLKQYLFSVLNFYFFFRNNIELNNFTHYSKYIDLKNNKFDKCILFVRDPKKIILSSYYYHLKCEERWALRENDINNFVRANYPNKKTEDVINLFYKSDLTINSNLSYQKILQDLPELEGLKFDFLKCSILIIHGMEILLKNLDYNKYLIVDCDRFTNDPSVDFKRIKTRLFPNLNTERITKIYKKKLDINKNFYINHQTNSSKKDLPDFINNIYQEKFPELDNLYNKFINLSYLDNK